MYKEELERMISKWEPKGSEVVRVIDSFDDIVERIVKEGDEYSLYRYFTLGDEPNVHVSVDLRQVTADHIIQQLAERL